MRLILVALSVFAAVAAMAQPTTNVDAGALVGTWVGSHRGLRDFNTAELRITRVDGAQVFGSYRLDVRQSATHLQQYYNNDIKCTGVVDGNSLYLKTEIGVGNVKLNISSTDGKLTMAGQVEGQGRAFPITLIKQ